MGYETKLIIGTLTELKGYENKDCQWVNVIAEINLCKSVFWDTWIKKERDTTKVYIFSSDGNTEITKDRYGSQLFALNPQEVLDIMVKENEKQNYRRYNAAIPLLENLIRDFEGEDLTCILYGY